MNKYNIIFLFLLHCALVLAAAAGCGGKESDGDGAADGDAGGDERLRDDGGGVEAEGDAAADAAPDGGEGDAADAEEEEAPDPLAGQCRACTWDTDCPAGGSCIHLSAGEMGCVVECEVPEDCPEGSGCVTTVEADGLHCVPDDDTCVVSGLGADCPNFGCRGRNSLCSDPSGDEGYCTHWCEGRVDCDAGFMECRDRGDGVKVCMRDPRSPAERCGATAHGGGIGEPCASGTCAGADLVCSSTVAPALPAVCTKTCADDAACAAVEGARCVRLPGGGETKHCVPPECACMGAEPGSLLDTLLAAEALTRCDLQWRQEDLSYFGEDRVNDRFKIAWTRDYHADWLSNVPLARAVEEETDAAAGEGPWELVERAAARTGHPIAGGETAYDPGDVQPLASAVTRLMTALGETPDQPAYEADAADVPLDVQRFAARVILAAIDAIAARGEAIAPLGGDRWKIGNYFQKAPSLVLPWTPPTLDVEDRQVQDFLIGDFGYEALYQAAYDVARTVARHAADVSAHPATETFSFNQSTPAGKIIVSDGRDTAYTGTMSTADYLLVVDVGGDDTYEIGAGGNGSRDNPVSLLVDLGGADTYGYHEVADPNDGTRLPSDGGGRARPTSDYGPFTLSNKARQGSGRLGIGMLFDFGDGDDEYRSLRMSQGSGILGLGLLYDAGGSDTYACEAACQGSGIFGIGILEDAGGNGAAPGDRFSSYHASQGFAYAGAVGILVNAQGDDVYYCNQDDVLYPSPQDGASNSSFCQGTGFGRRADVEYGGDGVFMSGGLGVLRDLQGSDDYTAAIFAQGTGYWFGIGMLLDAAGDDEYDARWYVQGAGAHFATGILHDGAGSDRYNLKESRRLNVVGGGGHDVSNAFLIDDGGADAYRVPGIALGGGNDNGFGLLVDRGGDDAYESSSGYSFGNAGITPGMMRALPSVGIFLDCGGTDAHARPDTSLLGNDRTWQQKVHPSTASEHGLGGDTSTLPCGI